jgi:hypothetical protein
VCLYLPYGAVHIAFEDSESASERGPSASDLFLANSPAWIVWIKWRLNPPSLCLSGKQMEGFGLGDPESFFMEI